MEAGESGALRAKPAKVRQTDALSDTAPPRTGRPWACLGLIVVLSLIAYGHLLAPGKTPYSPHSDFVSEHISTKQVLYDSVWRGHGIPLWRNDQFSGYAGLISPQSQYTYPLHFLFYLLPPLSAAGPTFWLHFLASGVAYYLLGSAMGLGRWPRLVMSAAGLFSMKLIMGVYAGWLPNIPIMIAFPLLFAGVFYLVRRPGLLSALAAAGAGALCLHCGHLQLLYYSLWLLLAYLVIWAGERVAAGDVRMVRRAIGWLATAGVLSVALSAYLIVPLAAEAGLISRSRSAYEFFLGGHAIQTKHLVTFLAPEALGTPLEGTYPGDELWEDQAYFGLLPLALGFAGAVLGWRRKPTKYLAACFAATLLLSMDSRVLRFLFDHLPGFSLFRIPARFLFLTTFFGIALAGIGLEELIDRLRRARRPVAWLAAVMGCAIVALMTVEGTYYAHRYLKTVPHSQAVPDTAYWRFLAKDTGLFRVAPIHRSTISYGWAAPMGLQLITGNDSFNYRQYADYFDVLQWGQIHRTIARAWYDLVHLVRGANLPRLEVRGDLMDLLNVKYVVSPVALEFPDGHFEPAAAFDHQPMFVLYQGMTTGPTYLYRNRSFLERAFWAEAVMTVTEADDLIPAVQQRDIRATAVVLAERSESLSATSRPTEGDEVKVLHAWNGRLELSTRSAGGRFLVVSEIWHPGWRAWIDGQSVPLYRTNIALLGLSVPPGEHRVRLAFRPLLWWPSLAISGAGAVAFVALAACTVRRKLRPGKVSADPAS